MLSVGTACVVCGMGCRNARTMRNAENVGMSWREMVAVALQLERPLGIHKEWMTHDSYVGACRLLESLEACRPCRTLTLTASARGPGTMTRMATTSFGAGFGSHRLPSATTSTGSDRSG